MASVSIDVLAQNVAPVAQDLSLSGNGVCIALARGYCRFLTVRVSCAEDVPISVSLAATDATHSPSDLTFRVRACGTLRCASDLSLTLLCLRLRRAQVSQVIRDNVGVLHQFDAGAPDNVGDAVAVGELLATDQLVFVPFTDVVGTFGGIYACVALYW